ncbi:ShlB/FhaC/HecB family hemolysin secretion/activation protein [Novosphingobium sp. M1R2S20]|uniref:ShlB/FhaC/HecB family hemolysin secretion/activation protein n=1 Tax=Novosphingobium rhizovicinum TaxID=3228928 RepID=A0ABV3RG51_9SPHN
MKNSIWFASACGLFASPVFAQSALDRVTPRDASVAIPAATGDASQLPTEVENKSRTVQLQGEQILIGAVSISGLESLQPSEFADIISDYVGKTAGPNDLAVLTDRLAQRARDRGFVFATAQIAPQRLSLGVLTVLLDEGRVDAVRLDGSQNTAVKAALAGLTEGPVKLERLERALLLADDIDGIQIGRSRLLRENGQRVLVVEVTEDRASADVSLRNDGTRPIGREKVYISAVLSQLLDADDSVTFGYAGTSFEPGELQYGRVRYEKRLNASGTEATASFSYSLVRPGAYLSQYDIEGRAWSANIGLLQPVHRTRQSSLWLTANLEVNRLKQTGSGRLFRRDRTTVLRLGAYGYHNALGGRIRGGAVVSRGLDLFDATEARNLLASRYDADGTFTSLSLWGQWTGELVPRVSLQVSASGQLASESLLVGEELGLGGGAYLRGYDWSERLGDRGAMGYAELRYDFNLPPGFLKRAQVYGFADAGEVSNLDDGFGGGSLASAGGGLRLGLRNTLNVSLEVAQPLTGPRYDTGDRQPRVNFGINANL